MCSDSLAGLPARGSALQVSVDNIVLASIEGSKTVMRHSTTRIAYSTVDTGKPKVFSYVAVVKNTQLEFTNGGWCMHDEASPLWCAAARMLL